jgi:hypothetical protein
VKRRRSGLGAVRETVGSQSAGRKGIPSGDTIDCRDATRRRHPVPKPTRACTRSPSCELPWRRRSCQAVSCRTCLKSARSTASRSDGPRVASARPAAFAGATDETSRIASAMLASAELVDHEQPRVSAVSWSDPTDRPFQLVRSGRSPASAACRAGSSWLPSAYRAGPTICAYERGEESRDRVRRVRPPA